jgi:hypothetical protein
MHKPNQTMSETTLGREIRPLCDLRATAVTAASRYGVGHEMVQQRVPAMMAYLVSDGRLCALKLSEWAILLVGVALCGLIALLF